MTYPPARPNERSLGAPLAARPSRQGAPVQPANLADLLERVLDKGIVIAGDIRVNLLDIELLTIRIRLLVASVDRAREMGIDWWEHDPTLSSSAGQRDLADENRRLRERVGQLEARRSVGPGRAEEEPETPGRSSAPEAREREEGP